jgi:hypothetical protein
MSALGPTSEVGRLERHVRSTPNNRRRRTAAGEMAQMEAGARTLRRNCRDVTKHELDPQARKSFPREGERQDGPGPGLRLTRNQRRSAELGADRPAGGSCMRLTLAALCVATSASLASAQTQSEQKQPADSQHSTGHTVLPDDNKGQLQPQGWTGPITTGSGGTPAASPQGQSPPGMQAAPDGSSKSIADPK